MSLHLLNFLALGATPAWVMQLGIFVIILFFLMGGALMAVRFFREIKGPPAEPAHTPTVETKIRTEVVAAEARFGQRIGQVEASFKKENNQLHGRVSTLRDEIKTDMKRTEDKVTEGVDKMQTMYATTCERIGKCETENQHQERTIIAHGVKLDRHIEKG